MNTSDLTQFLGATRDPERLAVLRRTALLDSPAEESFDRLTRLAARLLNAPVALVSLVDEDRQFFKSQCGLPEPWASQRETPLSHSFCQHVVGEAAPLIIEDAREHPLVRDNLAIRDLNVIAYAGVPLLAEGGHVLGSFCVIDDKPRTWAPAELEVLRDLAQSAMTEISLRTLIATSESDRREMAALLQSTSEGIYGIDEQGRCTFINPAGAALLGYAPEDVLGRNIHSLVHHSHADGTPYPEARCPIAQASRENRDTRVSGEVFWRRDGTPIPVEYSSSPIREGGTVRGSVITFVDIGERIATERQLRESEQRQRFLGEASALLASSLEVAPTLQNLADLAVPRLADWCAVYLADDETEPIVPVAIAHADPTEQSFAWELLRRYPQDRSAPAGAAKVIRTGEPDLLVEITDELLQKLAGDEEHLRLLRELRLSSFLAAPLTSHGRVLGAVAFYSADPARRYGEADLEVATELARRAAVAVENARLVEAQQRDADALRISEQRFRSLVQATSAIVWDTPPSGQFETEQPAWSEFTGQSYQQYRGSGWADALHPDDRAHTAEGWRAALETRSLFTAEHRLRRRDGEYRHMLVRAVPIVDDQGELREWVGIHTDVTEARQLESALRDSENRFRLMFQDSPLPMWVFDLDTMRFLDVNAAAVRHYGYSRDEFLSMTVRDIRPPEDVEQLNVALGGKFRGLVHRGGFRHRKKDGEVIDVEVSTQEISLEGRSARVAVVVDVTARRRAEEEREQLIRALELERQRLEHVFQEAPAVIALYRGPEHVVSMVNPTWSAMTGKRDALGKRFADVFPELRESGLPELLDRVYQTGEPYVGTEMPVLFDRDGDGELEQSYWNFVWQPLTDADGQVQEIMVHAVEVTDQVLAREQVESLAVERTAILSQLAEGVIVANAQGRLTFVNDAAQRIHGTRRLDVRPEEHAETYHLLTLDGEPYPADQLPLARAVRNGETVTDATWRIRRPDGTEVVAQGNAAPVRAEDGRQVAAVLTLRDVTQQQLLQRQVELERQRLNELVQQAPALIAVLRGPDHVFEIANPGYLALVGHRDVLGKPLREAVPEVVGQGYVEMLDDVYRGGQAVIGNERMAELDRRGDGVLEPGYFNFVFHPLREADGSVGGILIHAVEVTEQVRARQEVEQKAEELSRLARALELSNRELDQFAYVASHDLKAPLRGIANLSNWIEEDLGGEINAEVRDHLDLLRGRVHRMEGLIDGILQYSRAGRVREKPEPIDTGALLEEVIDLLAPPEDIEIRVAREMPTLTAERLPLQQVFMNLIGNAVKYNRSPDPWVAVDAWEHPEHWEFSVSDNGPGIAPEYHDRIFGIFQTLEARDKVEGTGIGLSLVKKLVESRGGRIELESAEGAGAVFRVLWPKELKREG